MLRIIVTILAIISTLAVFWLVTKNKPKAGTLVTTTPALAHTLILKGEAKWEDKKFESAGNGVRERKVGIPNRQSAPFGTKPVEPAAVLAVLASDKQTVTERVQQLQTMRGIVLSSEERGAALALFAGKQVPANIDGNSLHWLADELMTVLRLQQLPQENLAAELGKIAFKPGTDPVVRDYLMQHLGHLWEQFGPRDEIEKSLWLAVASSDETTPGTALIALSRGYERDQQPQSLEKVRQQALALAQNPATGLAVRVTALSIAGEGQGAAVKELANGLITNPATPMILRKVAGRVIAR